MLLEEGKRYTVRFRASAVRSTVATPGIQPSRSRYSANSQNFECRLARRDVGSGIGPIFARGVTWTEIRSASACPQIGRDTRMKVRRVRQIVALLTILVAVPGLSTVAFADEHLRGVVSGRAADGSLTVRTDDAEVTVVLNENTKVRQDSRFRSHKVDVASLIPGLRVDVHGTYQNTTQLLADRITFKKNDLKLARDIQAGIAPTNQAVVVNRTLIDANQQQNTQRFGRQQEAIDQNQQKIAANEEKIVATGGRIANLDEYSLVDSMTVYFRNKKSAISSDFKEQLRQLAEKIKGIEGYAVQIEGYASAVGSDALNQNLSKDRAQAVAAVLLQSGIPSTKM